MKLSVFTASTPEWTPEETVIHLAEQGWDGVEWRVTDQMPSATPGFWVGNRSTWPFSDVEHSADEIERLTIGAGLEYSAIGGYRALGDRDGVEAMIRLTARLGAHRVRVVMPPTNDKIHYPTVFDEARRELRWVSSRAAAAGVKVLVEMHQNTIVTSASAAIRLVDGLDPETVGVIHDLGNMVIEGHEHPRSALQALGPYLAHVHVKNASWHPTDSLRPDGSVVWESRWAPLRSGIMSVSDYFGALLDVGYDGWITVEDFSTELPLEERTRENLAYLRSLLALSAS